MSDTRSTSVGTFILEVKVWDNVAQEWSNTATKEVTITPQAETKDDSESELEIGEWVLPIGLAVIVLLLLGYMLQSRKK